MVEKKSLRRGIPFDEEDEKIVKAIKAKLLPTQGDVNVTTIVRMGLRALLENLKAKK